MSDEEIVQLRAELEETKRELAECQRDVDTAYAAFMKIEAIIMGVFGVPER